MRNRLRGRGAHHTHRRRWPHDATEHRPSAQQDCARGAAAQSPPTPRPTPGRDRPNRDGPVSAPITGLAVDWVDGHRRDAILIGRTLVDWVDRTWRTKANRQHRAIAGYSGGGLSAAHLAERFPDVFGQLGVFSGAVELRNPAGQPSAYALFEAEKVCADDDSLAAGRLGDPITHADACAAVDPLHGAEKLQSTTVWLSSGNGLPCTPEDTANLVYPTAATEPQMRGQANAFSSALTAAGVQHVNNRRPCGLHWCTTLRPDLNTFWDLASARWQASG